MLACTGLPRQTEASQFMFLFTVLDPGRSARHQALDVSYFSPVACSTRLAPVRSEI